MPTISMFYGIIIRMYFAPKEHPPPHFHARCGREEISVDIADGAVTGYLSPRKRTLVQRWRNLHQEELLENWNP